MGATSLDLSQIKTDALSTASTFRSLIGLGNVNNTSDANKPISSATQSALDGKLSLSGGTLTGALSGTSATFSGVLTVGTVGSTLNRIAFASGPNGAAGAYDIVQTYPEVILFRRNQIGFAKLENSVTESGSYTGGLMLTGGGISWATNSTVANGQDTPNLCIMRDAADALALRRSTNAQTLRIYGTYTDASNYRRLYISSTTAGAFTLGVEGAGTGASGNTLTVANDLNISGLQITLGDSTHWLYNSVGTGFGLMFSGFGSKLTFNGNFILTGRYTNHELYVGHQNARIIYGTQSYTNTDTNRVIVQAVDGLHIRNTPATTSATAFLYNTFTDASNYIRQSLSFTTYSSTVHAQHVVEGAGTGAVNVPFVITPRGDGAFILGRMADGTIAGGNLRGRLAVDLQMERSFANEVASGQYSAIIGGAQSRASGYASLAFGIRAVATGTGAVAIGSDLTASGNESNVIGTDSEATSFQSMALGRGAKSVVSGQIAYAAWKFSSRGDAQGSIYILLGKTTNNTPASLFCQTWNSSRLLIPSGKLLLFTAKIVGVKSDGTAAATYYRKGCIENVGGTTMLVGNIETIGTDHEDNPLTDVSITADNTNDALDISVTGITGETWRWVAVVEGVEVAYGT